MKDDIQAAIRKMKSGKATGPDNQRMVIKLLHKIYSTDHTPPDISRCRGIGK